MQVGTENDLGGTVLFNSPESVEDSIVEISTAASDSGSESTSSSGLFNGDIEAEDNIVTEAEKVVESLPGDQNGQSKLDSPEGTPPSDPAILPGDLVSVDLEFVDDIDWVSESKKYKELSNASIKTKEDFIFHADRAFAINNSIIENEGIQEISNRLSLTDEELLIDSITSDAKPWEDDVSAARIASLYEPVDKSDESKGMRLKQSSVNYAAKLRNELSQNQISLVNEVKGRVEKEYDEIITYKSNLRQSISGFDFMGVKLSEKTQQDVYRYIVEGDYATKTGVLTREGEGHKHDAETAIWSNKSVREALISHIVKKQVDEALSKQIKDKLV